MPLGTLPFSINKRRSIDLGYSIAVYYPDYSESVNKCMHRAVEACPGMTVPTTLHGTYVVVHGRPSRHVAEHADMSLADFRHTLDFFSTYFDDTVYDSPNAHSVQALKISSPLEYKLYGRATFTSVWVDREFISGERTASDLALRLLGFEVWVCPVKETEMERQGAGHVHVRDAEDKGGGWENAYVRVLTRKMDDVSWGDLGGR
jgi:hypothetical protein